MDSIPELTTEQKALIDRMTASAGELLFEASAHDHHHARALIKELAHHLGRLYGETIRACRHHGGLKEEVTTTFMCGMALEPNFGREEVLRDPGAEAQEEKTPGQLLYEEKRRLEPGSWKCWDQLPPSCHIAYENKAKEKAAMEKILDAPVGAPLPLDPPFATIDWDKDEEVQEEKTPGQLLYEGQPHGAVGRPWAKLSDNCRRGFEKETELRAKSYSGVIRITEEEMRDPRAEECKAMYRSLHAGGLGLKVKDEAAQETRPYAATDAKLCWKCKGTKDMGFTTYMACDAC